MIPREPAAPAPRGQLEVVFGLPPRRIPIGAGDTTLGSSPGCDVTLPHPDVSSPHCRLDAREAGCWIEDAGSATGTFVNGSAVQSRGKLRPGDVLQVGGVGLRWWTNETAGLAHGPALVIGGRLTEEIAPDGQPLVLGRDAECDVLLASDEVAGRHARIEGGPVGARVVALAGTGGCLVNGRHFDRHQLVFGDQLDLGPYHFLYDGRVLRLTHTEAGASLVAEELTFVTRGRRLLDRVSLRIEGNEFVGIIGPTGAGKSTLLKILSGQGPTATGRVLLNGNDLYAHAERYRRDFGWVPQADIVHRDLTVAEALVFAARLRLPRETPPRELARLVTETAGRLGLQEKMESLVGTLSGGETKKVSVAVELLCRPRILFLDEPTSGLDPGAETRLMELLRELANGGCTVVCTTHIMQNLHLLDRVVVLSAGELVFSGPPADASEFFGIREPAGIFTRLEERKAAEWRAAFRAIYPPAPAESRRAEPFASRAIRTAFQPFVLLQRQWATWTSDWRNGAILLAQPLLIGLLLTVAVEGTVDDSALKLFFASVATLWFGCSNGAQAIIGELAIYRRERMAGLHRGSYVFSKWMFLGLATLLQSGLLYVVIRLTGAGLDGAAAWQLGGLAAMSLVAACLGLAISAVSRSAMQAVLLVPLLIIPQIVLSGYTVPASSMTPPILAISECVPSFQLQRLMDVSLLWERKIDAATLQSHLQAVQDLNLDQQLRTGTTFTNPEPGLRALAIIGAWLAALYAFTLVTLRWKERDF